MFASLAAAIDRHRFRILTAAGVFLLLAVAVLFSENRLTTGTIAGLEADRAQAIVDAIAGRPQDTTLVVLFQSNTLDPNDDAFVAAMDEALRPLRSDPDVASVVTPEDAEPSVGLTMVNGPARAALAFVSVAGDFKTALRRYPKVRRELASPLLAITCTGRLPFVYGLDGALERDLQRAEAVSLPLALGVLLWVFRSLLAALLPVLVGGLAVVGGIAVVLVLGRFVDIAQYTINVCSLIGLGVAIDYSLFLVSRWREELSAGRPPREALAAALSRVGPVIAFSGAAVATGLSGLLFFRGSYLSAMGIGGAIVVFLAVVAALTVLPALLSVLGPRVDWGRLGRARDRSAFWRDLAARVMRRPLLVLLPTLGLLLFISAPFLHLRLATAAVGVLPHGVEARRGYELLARAFPEEARTRIAVAIRFPSAPALTPARIGALYDLSRGIAAVPHVAKVESVVAGAGLDRAGYQRELLRPSEFYAGGLAEAKKLLVRGDATVLYALTDLPAESEGAQSIVRAIRRMRPPAGGLLLVGGQTASDVDTTAYVLTRMPWVIGFVIAVTAVVLFLLLGSATLPLEAVVMNLLSLGGSFGALVWIFQEGHLFAREPRPVEPSLPILLFCVLFGLSMDYEVLMLSRIAESWERTRDNTAAIADGLARTAGLITSAAAIMVVVFGAFALAKVVLIQAVGAGMALAVALDATFVRVLLVPATMRLFGDANWWLPAPMGRWRARRRRPAAG